MPAALSIRGRKAASIPAMLRTDFREYPPGKTPKHVDPERIKDNRVLHGSRDALKGLPKRQPGKTPKDA